MALTNANIVTTDNVRTEAEVESSAERVPGKMDVVQCNQLFIEYLNSKEKNKYWA